MKKMSRLFLGMTAALALGTQTTHASVWDDTESWNAEWENRYSVWLETEFKLDTFSRREGNELAMPVSSLMLFHAPRALFAFEHHLPFLIQRSDNARAFISNRSTAFDGVDVAANPKARFVAFMQGIKGHFAYDRIAASSFPIRVQSDALRAGAYFLNFLNWAEPDSPPSVSLIRRKPFAPVFVASRTLLTGTLLERSTPIQKQPSGASGFLSQRWPNEALNGFVDPNQSGDARYGANDQNRSEFAPDITNPRDTFSYRIQLALTGTPEDNEQKLRVLYRMGVQDLCNQVENRVVWVDEALRFVDSRRATEPAFSIRRGSRDWEVHSTPSRDRAILGALNAISQEFDAIPQAERITALQGCVVKFGAEDAQQLTLHTYWQNARTTKLSSDPNASLADRWGVL